jgi:Cu2+-exporting ATPase
VTSAALDLGAETPACAHCGEPVSGHARFCCSGCAAAYQIIHDLGFERYYSQRTLGASARAPKPDDELRFDFAQHAQESNGASSLSLLVEGLHCGACVWLIERTLQRNPGVIEARVNLTAQRLTLRWRSAEASANDLTMAVQRLGYRLAPFSAVAARESVNRRTRSLTAALAVAGFAAGNLMLLSIGIWAGIAQGMGEATRSLLHWASAAIALPAIAYGGQPFFRSAFAALRNGRSNMDVPISVGVLLVTGMSLAETVRGGEHTYFDSAAALLFFLLIGRLLDQRARGRAREAAEHLTALIESDVTVIASDGKAERRSQALVRVGDRILVGIGEKIGADGTIVEGASTIDTSVVTGESLPAPAGLGAKVFAGSVNIETPLIVKVTAVGADTLLAECARLVEAAEFGRSRFVVLADRVARLYAPVVHLVALATFLLWWRIFDAPISLSLLIATSVLIITCPCALALAVPAVQVIATGRLFRRGILLKSATALERIAQVDTVVFDKTGTLTEPALALVANGRYGSGDLREAAALATVSRHPLARALAAAAGPIQPFADVREVTGAGLVHAVSGGETRLGSRAFCNIAVARCADGPELWFRRANGAAICFEFAERLRRDAGATIQRLNRMGMRLALLSGDRPEGVAKIARDLALDDVCAALSPVGKVEELNRLAASGARTLMVGDGLNDGPALAAAFLSMSPATAADLSQTVADIVFQGDALAPVAVAIEVARRARRLVAQNIGFSISYNLVMVPLAVAGYVTPWLAAIAMSGSSLVVTMNSLRLSRDLAR